MAVTKEALLARIAQIEADKEQHIGQANACSGAVQELRRLVGELDKQDGQVQQTNVVKIDDAA